MAKRKKVTYGERKLKNELIEKEDHFALLCKVTGKDEYMEVLIDEKGIQKILKESNAKWFVVFTGGSKMPYVYGTCGSKKVTMHRLLMNFPPKGQYVDHMNRNTLDNRYSNLRIVNASENARNRNSYGMSGVRNVHWDKKGRRWVVNINVNGKLKNFGTFKDIYEAEIAAIKARRELGYLD